MIISFSCWTFAGIKCSLFEDSNLLWWCKANHKIWAVNFEHLISFLQYENLCNFHKYKSEDICNEKRKIVNDVDDVNALINRKVYKWNDLYSVHQDNYYNVKQIFFIVIDCSLIQCKE